MNVRELLDELHDRDPELEVTLSLEGDDGEWIDAVATSAYVSVGRMFIAAGDES